MCDILIRNFKNCAPDNKILLFKTYCAGFHSRATWSNYRTKSMDKLKVTFNNICRILMGIGRRKSISKHMLDNKVDCFKCIVL